MPRSRSPISSSPKKLSADPSWQVRRASTPDAAALSLVAGASFLETFAGVLEGDDIVAHCAANSSAAAFEKWLHDSASVVVIAELVAGRAPVGYAVLTAPDLPIDTGPHDIELKRIYTLSRMHGLGLGPALMMRAVRGREGTGPNPAPARRLRRQHPRASVLRETGVRDRRHPTIPRRQDAPRRPDLRPQPLSGRYPFGFSRTHAASSAACVPPRCRSFRLSSRSVRPRSMCPSVRHTTSYSPLAVRGVSPSM